MPAISSPAARAASAAPPLRDGPVLAWGLPLLSGLIAWLSPPAGGPLSGRGLLVHGLLTLLLTASYWLSERALWRGLLRMLPRPDQTARRLVLLALLAVVVAGAVTAALLAPLHAWQPAWFPLSLAAWLLMARFSLIPTVLVLALYEAAYFFGQWQANVRRADLLAQAQTQAQLDALAQQLDPHFLFNSLNTLAALIDPANAAAQTYVEGLADVYRYVLLSREQPTVPLADELAFVKTYVALQKVRFRDNVVVSYDVPAAALATRVAPLSLQLLVENALKHNVASRAQPLHLRLDATPTTFTVANTYQPRPAGQPPGTGTGLANVRQRYALLGAAGPVAITQTAGIFAVTVPLLPAGQELATT